MGKSMVSCRCSLKPIQWCIIYYNMAWYNMKHWHNDMIWPFRLLTKNKLSLYTMYILCIYIWININNYQYNLYHFISNDQYNLRQWSRAESTGHLWIWIWIQHHTTRMSVWKVNSLLDLMLRCLVLLGAKWCHLNQRYDAMMLRIC